MYYYGSGSGCGGCFNTPMPYTGYGGNSTFAIILVLFILLVIVIGPRFCF